MSDPLLGAERPAPLGQSGTRAKRKRTKAKRPGAKFALVRARGEMVASLGELVVTGRRRKCSQMATARYSEMSDSETASLTSTLVSDDEEAGSRAASIFGSAECAEQSRAQQRHGASSSQGVFKLVLDKRRSQQQQRRSTTTIGAQEVKRFSPSAGQQGKCSVVFLLCALFSARRRAHGFRDGPLTRAKLLARLLRLPAVLGALFSLSLVITLLVFYALSFLHCERLRMRDSLAGAQSAPGANQHHTLDADRTTKRALVASECGQHVGHVEGPAFVFRGIAYAAPPVGALRWRKPRPIWQDERLCAARNSNSNPSIGQTAAAHCLQLSPFNGQKQLTGSEDCLYLDIYVPSSALQIAANQSAHKPLPVMVYVHGGFLAFGSNGRPEEARVNWLGARPSGQLAAELNVLLVAPNFRLQALGFMTLGRLGGDSNSAGNFGLWDQLVALHWIQRNIGQFGGDAQNVALFGPDSASALPLALLANRAPRALPFHAVWLSNPSVYFALAAEQANQHYERLIRGQSICSTANRRSASGETNDSDQLRLCLMGLAGEQIVRDYLGKDDASYRLDDQNSLPIRNILPEQFVDLDGELVSAAFPFAVLQAPTVTITTTNLSQPKADKLRLLIGSSSEAAEFWPCPRNLHAWSWDDFRKYVAASLNTFSADTYARACQQYTVPAATGQPENQSDPAEVYLKMVSDIKQVCPVNELFAHLGQTSARQLELSRYIVEQRPSEELTKQMAHSRAAIYGAQVEQLEHADFRTNNEPGQLKFSFHYFDLLAFFGYANDVENVHRLNKEDLNFQKQVRQMVKDFVWNNSSADGDGYTLLRSGMAQRIKTTIEYRAHECKMWKETLNGQSYAWIS